MPDQPDNYSHRGAVTAWRTKARRWGLCDVWEEDTVGATLKKKKKVLQIEKYMYSKFINREVFCQMWFILKKKIKYTEWGLTICYSSHYFFVQQWSKVISRTAWCKHVIFYFFIWKDGPGHNTFQTLHFMYTNYFTKSILVPDHFRSMRHCLYSEVQYCTLWVCYRKALRKSDAGLDY